MSGHTRTVTRRQWLAAAGVTSTYLVVSTPLQATPAELQDTLAKLSAGKKIQTGKVTLKLPALAENGNSVRISVAVDHPMSESNYVQSITLLAQENPLPNILTCKFTPLAGQASFEARIRVAAEQDIVALAHLSDGTVWSASAHIVVTEAACLEALI